MAANINLGVKQSTKVNNFTVKLKSDRNGNNAFNFAFAKGDYRAKMGNVGLTNTDILKPKTVGLMVAVFVNNTFYKSDKILTYKSRAGKNGAAKQSN